MALRWLWWRAWFPFGAVVAAAAWQAWHLAASTFTLRCRRGTWRHRRAFCVASVPLMALRWLWWRAWFPFGAVVAAAAWQAWHLAASTFTLRCRRGTWRHRRAFCVASVPLMALGWLWWRAWFPFGAVVAAAVCVAGEALGDIDLHSTWQAWHLAAWAVTLHGRRGTWHRRAFCVAGVPLWHWRAWFPFGRLRGKRGTWRHQPSLCVAGVALGDIDLHSAWGMALCDIDRHFVWQAWPLAIDLHFAWQAWNVALCIYASLCISMYLYVCISMCLYVSPCM